MGHAGVPGVAGTTAVGMPTGWRTRARGGTLAHVSLPMTEAAVEREQLEEMGPVDYVVLEWPNQQPTGEAIPLILDLVDKGIIRILDIAVLAKDSDGTVASLEIGSLGGDGASDFSEFEGAQTGLIGDDELEEAAGVLEPGTMAAVLVWENRWAAPVAVALRRSGGQLVASGRIPIQAVLAALDAARGRDQLNKRRHSCRDCFAALHAPPSSPGRRHPSATASRAARPAGGLGTSPSRATPSPRLRLRPSRPRRPWTRSSSSSSSPS